MIKIEWHEFFSSRVIFGLSSEWTQKPSGKWRRGLTWGWNKLYRPISDPPPWHRCWTWDFARELK